MSQSCTCRRCRRGLTNPKHIRLGIGPVCLKKEAQEATAKRPVQQFFTFATGGGK